MSNTRDTICIVIALLSPIMSAILLFNHLKMSKNATQKKRKQKEKVLHGKPRRNSPVKTAVSGDQLPQLSLTEEIERIKNNTQQ